MSPRLSSRWLASTAVVACVLTSVLLLPAVALADEPSSEIWSGAESFYTPLYVVLVFVGGPLALFLAIALFGSLGQHRTYPRPPLGEEAAIEAGEQHGRALRRPTGMGDDPGGDHDADATTGGSRA